MNPLDSVNQYLHALERRLKMFALSRGSALTAVVALSVTVLMVYMTNRYAFSSSSLFWARLILFVSLGAALALGLVLPFLRINRRRAASQVENEFPQFQQRLLTLAESKSDPADPFTALLASDAAEVARSTQPSRVAPTNAFAAFLLSTAAAAGVLLWLILAGPGYMGHGASLLWAGVGKNGSTSTFYDIIVTPGDFTVRRRADQMVTAELVGYDSRNVRLKAKFDGTSKWEDVQMVPRPGAPGFEFVLAAIPNPVEYYVEAGPLTSKHFKLNVIDLPSIQKVKVTYKYPAWTGMSPIVEDPGGDLRAVEGTIAEVQIQTDRPLSQGIVSMDGEKRIGLSGEGNIYKVEVPIQKDGMYHFAVMDRSQEVRLSDDYFIEARKDNPPTLKVVKPGKDAKVSPIEEVGVSVEAEDDFGLREVTLHYSVNGGEEKTVNMGAGKKEVRGSTTLFLEESKLVPGDVIALYATAKDARNQTKSDIYFIEAQPYERNYSQSQQQGGGGGGGGDEDGKEISKRQKEIIAATWNETRGQASHNSTESAENARFLTDVQNKLKEQAKSLSERAKSRQIAGTNAEFQSFIKSMDEAVKEMGGAADKLKGQGWKDALPAEQRALQNLLRAEATFKDIQVAFGNKGGGGGGGGGAARDLDNLFDLELDTEKNQYETGQQSQSSDQRQKDIDEALQKLEQLARRQQELAQQQQQKQQNFDQRWQQEQLRREAEQLRQKMEQLQRGQQSQSGQQQGQQSSQSSQSGSQSSQSGQQGQQGQQQSSSQQRMQRNASQANNEQRLKQAFDRVQQATDDMRRAASSPEQRDAGARRAADRLNEAKDLMRGIRQQQTSGQLGDLSQRADKLAGEQQEFYNRMRKQFGTQGAGTPGGTPKELEQLAQDKERMAKDLEGLERDTQRAARDLSSTQPKASSKLRDAVSAVQQDEVPLRMKYASNYIRQGKGSYMVTSEALSAMAIGKMRDGIKDAQATAEKEGDKQPGGPGKDSETGKALAQVERLREQLERASRGQQQGGKQAGQQQGGQQPGGQQPGQQQGGQQPGGQQPGGQQPGGKQQGGQQAGQQPGGQQPGQSPGGQQPGGQQSGQQQGGQQAGGQPGGGQRGGEQSGQLTRGGQQTGDPSGGQGSRNRGDLPQRGDAPINRGALGQAGDGGDNLERTYRETIRDLSQLRQQVGGGTDLGRDISDFIRDLQKVDPYALAGPALSDRLQKEVIPAMEQLELQLRHKLDAENGGQVRNPAAERIPAGYSDKVADYFRRLSGGAPKK